MKIKLFTLLLLLFLSVFGAVFLLTSEVKSPELQTQQPEKTMPQTEEEALFDKNKYSLSDPKSLWVIVNKKNGIPISYEPQDLVVPDVRLRLSSQNEQMKISATMEEDLKAMFAAAKKDGVDLVFGSGYRSATLQKQFYNSYVAQDGQQAADLYSARPGHSEHQTGLSFDVTAADGSCHLVACFADTPEGAWVAKNAHMYGFIIRYPEGYEEITGYEYEPWHLRYVGVELAREMNEQSVLTLEEFFDVAGGLYY